MYCKSCKQEKGNYAFQSDGDTHCNSCIKDGSAPTGIRPKLDTSIEITPVLSEYGLDVPNTMLLDRREVA